MPKIMKYNKVAINLYNLAELAFTGTKFVSFN